MSQPKLTKAQKALLAETSKAYQATVEDYPPTRRLAELGLVTLDPQQYGSVILRITAAGENYVREFKL